MTAGNVHFQYDGQPLYKNLKIIYLYKAVGNKVLIFKLDFGVSYETHNGNIIHENLTAVGSATDCLPNPFFHYLGGQIFAPTRRAEPMTTL